MGISASLKNVKHRHGNVFYGADSTAYQYALLISGYQDQMISGLSFISAGTATERWGDMEYIKVSPDDRMEIRTGVGRTYIDCNCGDCTIGSIAVSFADAQDPRIKRVYSCDEYGNPLSLVKAGSTVWLRVEMDEPIRFADNNPANYVHSDRRSRQSGNGHAVRESLLQKRT